MTSSPPPYDASSSNAPPPPFPSAPLVGESAFPSPSTKPGGEGVPLSSHRSYAFGISWDFTEKRNDLDLQAIIVDTQGRIIDAAFYNNLKACGKAVTHSGDERDGRREGIDEKVTFHLSRLPSNVSLMFVVVFCATGGTLRDTAKAKAHLLDGASLEEMQAFPLSQASPHSTGILTGAFIRDFQHPQNPHNAGGEGGSGGWRLLTSEVMRPLSGRHFMDALEELSETIRRFIPSAPSNQQVHFTMEKGGAIELTQSADTIFCGLGWDVTGHSGVDLDCSALLFDASANLLEAVFFGNTACSGPHSQKHAVVHSGDNLTGAGEGDDEIIRIQLSQLGPSVAQIFITISVYSNSVTFSNVRNPYCRVWREDDQHRELCKYQLAEAGNVRGLLMNKIRRDPRTGRWGVIALGIGLPHPQKTYQEAVPFCQSLFHANTGDSICAFSADPSQPPPSSLPPPPQHHHHHPGAVNSQNAPQQHFMNPNGANVPSSQPNHQQNRPTDNSSSSCCCPRKSKR